MAVLSAGRVGRILVPENLRQSIVRQFGPDRVIWIKPDLRSQHTFDEIQELGIKKQAKQRRHVQILTNRLAPRCATFNESQPAGFKRLSFVEMVNYAVGQKLVRLAVDPPSEITTDCANHVGAKKIVQDNIPVFGKLAFDLCADDGYATPGDPMRNTTIKSLDSIGNGLVLAFPFRKRCYSYVLAVAKRRH